jgi:hypothetical protein
VVGLAFVAAWGMAAAAHGNVFDDVPAALNVAVTDDWPGISDSGSRLRSGSFGGWRCLGDGSRHEESR